MGFFKSKKERLERKTFRDIVAKKSTQASRQAYADEAVKVAAERARAKARRPSFGEQIRARVSGSIERRIAGTTRRAPARRRRTVKAQVRRTRRTVRAPARKTIRRYAPVKRARRRASAQPRQTQPQSLQQAMYGGY